MRRPIFCDPEIQQLFDKQGYVLLPLLNDSQIQELRTLFFEYHSDIPVGRFISDSYSSDVSFKLGLSEKIVDILYPTYEQVFCDYQAFGASFLFKSPGNGSALAAHQDWSIVDENNFRALNCWIPLDDIHSENGALHVLPGSHSVNHHVLRAPTLPFFFSGHESLVHERLIRLEMPAGTAVVLDQSLIHYSSDNKSDAIRLAITAGVKTKGAPMQFHYFDKESGVLHRYAQPEDFLLRFEDFANDIVNPPKLGDCLDQINYTVPQYSKADLIKLLDSFLHRAGVSTSRSRKWGRFLWK